MRTLRHRLVHLTIIVGGISAALIGVVGFAHTDSGRPLLRYLPGMGPACPVGAGVPVDAAAVALARHDLLASLRGTEAARSRVAFGFELAESTRADVTAWAALHGMRCAPDRHEGMRCTGVTTPALSFAEGATVSFGFDESGVLASADASVRFADWRAASLALEARAHTLAHQFGAPTVAAPRREFNTGALGQTRIEYRHSDVRVQLRATSLGRQGFALRESYQVLPQGT